MIPAAIDSARARRLRQLLACMVVLLIFEGIARKAAPSFLSIPIFLLKDALTAWMAFYVVQMRKNPIISSLWAAYILVAVLMIPLIILTACYDPVLAVFGAKQYLLYPMVGFVTLMAFENVKWPIILDFYRKIAFLLIPIVVLALVQTRLPHNSWLNMSVHGESLEGFSSEGELRVSSTFPFVAQFCAFLNMEIFVIFIAMKDWTKQSLLWKVLTASLLPAILVGSFVTGSRAAVAGNLAILLLALLLGLFKFRASSIIHILLVLIFLYLSLLVVNHFFPSVTFVYSNREQGHLIGISEEIRGRVYQSFGIGHQTSYRSFLVGHGLGVMSNGVENISNYAAKWRTTLWTETDFGTTFFEGGLYLVLIWYGFRIFVILKTFKHFLFDTNSEFSVPMAFCQSFVIIMGLFGTLALQPPIAIWWWLGVGTSLLFSWKCIAPAESEESMEKPGPPPRRKIRGRSLYADVIHSRK